MDVNDVIQVKIEEARRKIEAARKRRAELDAARQRGLAARHAAKLRHLAEAEAAETGLAGVSDAPPESDGPCCPRAGAREADGISFRTAHSAAEDDTPEVA